MLSAALRKATLAFYEEKSHGRTRGENSRRNAMRGFHLRLCMCGRDTDCLLFLREAAPKDCVRFYLSLNASRKFASLYTFEVRYQLRIRRASALPPLLEPAGLNPVLLVNLRQQNRLATPV